MTGPARQGCRHLLFTLFACCSLVLFRPGVVVAGTHDRIGLTRIHAADVGRLVRADSAHVVLVNLWATWCNGCRSEMPDLLALRAEYPRNSFSLILFSADDPEDSVKAARYLDSLHVDFPTYISDDGSDEAMINGLDSAWSGALPYSILYGPQRVPARRFIGQRSGRQFRTIIDSLLSLPVK